MWKIIIDMLVLLVSRTRGLALIDPAVWKTSTDTDPSSKQLTTYYWSHAVKNDVPFPRSKYAQFVSNHTHGYVENDTSHLRERVCVRVPTWHVCTHAYYPQHVYSMFQGSPMCPPVL
jgi:hypothetical protein